MTLTLNQSDLYRFDRLIAKLIKPSAEVMVCFIPNSTGLKLAAFANNSILTMTIEKQGFVDPFSISTATLKTLAVKKDADIELTPQKDSIHVKCGEEQKWVPREKQVNTLPSVPKTTASNNKAILGALYNAAKCADTNNARNALNGICLRGKTSQILATTGIQLLVQEGFKFPFIEDVVCPVSKIFGSKELNDIATDEILLGQTNGWVYFSLGEIELWLRAIEGKFPNTATIVEPDKDTAYLDITEDDAKFILERFDAFPGKKEHESPLWLSLAKSLQVRAFDTVQKSGTALELTHSTFTGKNVSISMNREYFRNALKFGCLRLGIDPNDSSPVICFGEEKTYVFMPLSNQTEPEIEAKRMNIITSSIAAVSATTPAPVQVKRRRRRSVKPEPVKPMGKPALLQSAEQIRQDLRNSLLQVNTLIKEMRAQRSKDKLLQNTMDSLRKLSLA